jgi:hypothetical protein
MQVTLAQHCVAKEGKEGEQSHVTDAAATTRAIT